MNEFRCSFPYGNKRFDCSERDLLDFVSDVYADRICALAVGEKLVDEDGDTWERIA